MEFRFDPNLDYQVNAIQAVVRLFELLAAKPVSPALGSRDFSVEMETGTGKTYVYLRTALELHRAYGLRKFIVVVPSVANREAVLKTLRITREHFARLYDHVPYRFYEYDSGNLARVRQFAASTGVEIMVMTLDAFNKDSNVFNRPMDRMMGLKPLDLVQVADAINSANRRFLVDGVQYLELERDFALALEGMDEAKLFVKLPDWFTVETPIGTYNPDWAIVFTVQDAFGAVREKLYLVRETKGSGDAEERRGTENMKITPARRHFGALEVDYDVVTSAEELRGSVDRTAG